MSDVAQVGLVRGSLRYEAVYVDARHAKPGNALLVGDPKEPWVVAWASKPRVMPVDDKGRPMIAMTHSEVER